MRLIFRKTQEKKTHLGQDIRCYDGNVVDVAPRRGIQLMDAYPDNFLPAEIPVAELGEPVHEPLRLSQITVLTIHYWPPDVLKRCLLRGLPKEVELIKIDNTNNRMFTSAAKALNYGIRMARNDVVICTHEDTVFGKYWFDDFIKQECRLKDWGALGIVGWDFGQQVRWGSSYKLPCKVKWLDECCMIVDRKRGIWFDEETFQHFHCYGVDFCYQCNAKGLGVYVVAGIANHDLRGYEHDQAWFDQLGIEQALFNRKWAKKIS